MTRWWLLVVTGLMLPGCFDFDRAEETVCGERAGLCFPMLLGTDGLDRAHAVVEDANGNVYVAGEAWVIVPQSGGLAHYPRILVAKIDPSGRLLWLRQIGGIDGYSYDIYATSIDVVDWGGDVFVTGVVRGTLPDVPPIRDRSPIGSGQDVFIMKFNSNGVRQWTRQIGSEGEDVATGIAVTYTGNVYVSGYTDDLMPAGGWNLTHSIDFFVVKYDVNGEFGWLRQYSSDSTAGYMDDFANGISTGTDGYLYVAGSTWGDLPGYKNQGSSDAFLMKLDEAGQVQWFQQFGTSANDSAKAVVAQHISAPGDVYVAGTTDGANLYGLPSQGGDDVFVAAWEPDGIRGWTSRMGTSAQDDVSSIDVDQIGHVFVAGATSGAFPGQDNVSGAREVFVTELYSGGSGWIHQFGSEATYVATGTSVNNNGHVYVTGYTSGTFPGLLNIGDMDAFLLRYDVTNGEAR